MHNRFVMIQGRLALPESGTIQSFPRDAWRDEFERAAKAGYAGIEWIFDSFGEDVNPISTDAGIAEMLALQKDHGVIVSSICADWFMENPLANDRQNQRRAAKKLEWLISRARYARIRRIVLPFVDASKIETGTESGIVQLLGTFLPFCKENEVELHIESSMPPSEFSAFMQQLDPSVFFINYDSGNSASLGYRCEEEFAAYGDRIGSVHVKDRKLGGTTVPLGTGNADFDALFFQLDAIGYSEDLVMQVARGEPGDEVAHAIRNREFVQSHMAALGL